MMSYLIQYYDKLGAALLEHLQLVTVSLIVSLVVAVALVILCSYSRVVSKIMVHLFSVIYAIPSLAMFAMLIPLTGLGTTTAIIVLVTYNQSLLLRNFLSGLDEVDASVVEAANGMGMTILQVLGKVRIPLAKKALFAGVRIATVSTIGIATIAASINAGGLGTILFDGLRTMNIAKIVWGSILAAGLAIVANALLSFVERKLSNHRPKGVAKCIKR